MVRILQCDPQRKFVGAVNPAGAPSGKALFVSRDCRVPRIIVPLSEYPAGSPKEMLFIATITSWRADSQYADGKLSEALGIAGGQHHSPPGVLSRTNLGTA